MLVTDKLPPCRGAIVFGRHFCLPFFLEADGIRSSSLLLSTCLLPHMLTFSGWLFFFSVLVFFLSSGGSLTERTSGGSPPLSFFRLTFRSHFCPRRTVRSGRRSFPASFFLPSGRDPIFSGLGGCLSWRAVPLVPFRISPKRSLAFSFFPQCNVRTSFCRGRPTPGRSGLVFRSSFLLLGPLRLFPRSFRVFFHSCSRVARRRRHSPWSEQKNLSRFLTAMSGFPTFFFFL